VIFRGKRTEFGVPAGPWDSAYIASTTSQWDRTDIPRRTKVDTADGHTA